MNIKSERHTEGITSCALSLSKMNIKSERHTEGELISTRHVAPTHYTFKVQSFSLFSKHEIELYESNVFEAGGYKWKMLLYPNGNEKMNGKDHISLYLALVETESLPSGWEVNVVVGLFIFDQVRDKYMTLEDNGGRVRRFHALKTECGYSRLMPLATFKDFCNGYLVNDTCMFGAEVFVCKSNGVGECFSMVEDATPCHYTWKIEKFSQPKKEYRISEKFSVGNNKYNIGIYTKDDATLCVTCFDDKLRKPIYAKFMFRVNDQSFGKHVQETFTSTTARLGWRKLMELEDLNDPNRGFLVNDTLIIEAEVTVLGSVSSSK